MKTLLSQLRAALLVTAMLGAFCGGLYPFMVFWIGKAAFPDLAGGSPVVDRQGMVRGSYLIGQAFTGAGYFHPRPSAAGSGYDAAASGGSNLGPTSAELRDLIRERIAAYRRLNGLRTTDTVPADAVTASGSGLDPHISPESARFQAGRVAAARGLPAGAVGALVEEAVEAPQLGFLGEARVNVLKLNLALDRANVAR